MESDLHTMTPVEKGAPSLADGAGAEGRWRHTIGVADAATVVEACRHNRATTKPGGVGPKGRRGEAPEANGRRAVVAAYNRRSRCRHDFGGLPTKSNCDKARGRGGSSAARAGPGGACGPTSRNAQALRRKAQRAVGAKPLSQKADGERREGSAAERPHPPPCRRSPSAVQTGTPAAAAMATAAQARVAPSAPPASTSLG
jgi:hypothetical protein